MANSQAVWGLDIGQCGLKALRCKLDEDGETVVAEAYDYIEYPKILSQPDVEPAALIQDALKEFLSRNTVRGDKVGIAVSGQSGLARFIKLPPVEAKKIPDIVKYEARQQIPFPLEEVIWDYQTMPGGSHDQGIALENEVGIFAMKRDHLYRAIEPLTRAGIELDLVQLTPLCIYNAVVHDAMTGLPGPQDYDPENPPPSLAVLSIGTEATDMVVTDGFRVWQRSIPIGGNHFTRQLTKELKHTFVSAEQEKRKAREAKDPKAIFQAMRPVFNDLAAEVQRSISYFESLHREATLERVLLMGNTIKLPGLQQYLAKNLGYEVLKFDQFKNLAGPNVLPSPSFKDNVLAFPVAYGLALQGLGKARITTNLLPREITTARTIRSKKPWALAGVAVLIAALGFNFLFHWSRWAAVHPSRFEAHFSEVKNVSTVSSGHLQRDSTQLVQFEYLKKLGHEIVGNTDGRFLQLELLKALNDALPREPGLAPGEVSQLPFSERPALHIESIDSVFFPDLTAWFNDEVQKKYRQGQQGGAASEEEEDEDEGPKPPARGPTPPPAAAPSPAAPVAGAPAEEAVGPAGPGWVIELKGHHYHNEDPQNWGAQYVRTTLLKNLEHGTVRLPSGPGKEPVEFTMRELGIGYPILAQDEQIRAIQIANPNYEGEEAPPPGDRLSATPPPPSGSGSPQFYNARIYTFVVQFCWQEKRASQRMEQRLQNQLQTDQATTTVAGGF